MTPRRANVQLALLVATSCVWSSGARAEAAETKLQRAERLFTEGRDALQANRFAEACVKLSESQQLDPGTGTLLALALCHEGEGKLATAWREFAEVATQAEAQGRGDRVAMARQRLRALEPRLAHLTVTVGAVQIPAGLELRADGQALLPAQWNQPLVVEPGSHRVDAAAPGKKPWALIVKLAGAERRTVEIPRLEDLSPTEAPSRAPPGDRPTPESGPTREAPRANTTLSFVVGGAGLVALGVGTVFGVRALDSQREAERRCPSSPCADRAGVSANESARTEAWVANIGVGLGLVGVGVATWLLLRPVPTRAVTVSPSGGPRSAGVSLFAPF